MLTPRKVKQDPSTFQRKALVCSQVSFFPKKAIVGIDLRSPDGRGGGGRWRCSEKGESRGVSFGSLLYH